MNVNRKLKDVFWARILIGFVPDFALDEGRPQIRDLEAHGQDALNGNLRTLPSQVFHSA